MASPPKNERRITPQQSIARERMWRLFELAQKEWRRDVEGTQAFTKLATKQLTKTKWFPKGVRRSRRYVELIRGFSTRFRISIPREIKDSFCKHCGNLWVEGENVKRRVKGKTLNSNCAICGKLTRRRVER